MALEWAPKYACDQTGQLEANYRSWETLDDKDIDASHQIEQLEKEIASLKERLTILAQAVDQHLQAELDSKEIGRIFHEQLNRLLDTNNTCRQTFYINRNDMRRKMRQFFDSDVRYERLEVPVRRLLSAFKRELSRHLDGPGWPGDWAQNYCDLIQWAKDFQKRFASTPTQITE